MIRTFPGRSAGLPLGAQVLGVAAIIAAYRLAAHATITSAFLAFWGGMFIALIGAFMVVVSRRANAGLSALVLTMFGFITYLPMLLRRPDGPVGFDELAHWSQTENLLDSGKLFQPNIVSVISDFPGLHTISIGLVDVTGLSVWQVAQVLLIACHVLSLFGIRQIALGIGLEARTANLAALVYALNPGLLFFTSQFAYESVAIVLQIWALGMAIPLTRAPVVHPRRSLAISLLLGSAVVVTHHLTTLFMIFYFVVLAAAAVKAPTIRGRRRFVASLTGLLVVIAGVWASRDAAALYNYLVVFPKQGFHQLMTIVSGTHQSAATSRTAFSGSRLPLYEQKAAYLCLPVVFLFAAIGVWMLRRRWREPGIMLVAVVAALYPLSLPLVLTTTGAAGAHRSWPFSWEGVAVVVAVGMTTAIDRVAGNLKLVVTKLVVAGGAFLALMGNAATDFYEEAMFPGPYTNGIDARMITPEGQYIAEWMRAHTAGEKFVSADILTAGIFAAHARLDYVEGFPAWDLTFYDNAISRSTISKLVNDDISLLVVDRRVTDSPFRSGVYLNSGEPLAYVRTDPIHMTALLKLEKQQWLMKIVSSDHYDIYELNRDALPTYRVGPATVEEQK